MATPYSELEAVYEQLAESIDKAGEEKAPLFLAKLSLLLARELGDAERVRVAIKTALRDL